MTSPTTSGRTTSTQEQISVTKDMKEEEKKKIAFEAFHSVLTTPVRDKYEERLRDGYDVEGRYLSKLAHEILPLKLEQIWSLT